MQEVPGNTALKYDAFRQLQEEGLLTVTGAGVKGNPFLYLAAIPTEDEIDESLLQAFSDEGGQDSTRQSNEEEGKREH